MSLSFPASRTLPAPFSSGFPPPPPCPPRIPRTTSDHPLLDLFRFQNQWNSSLFILHVIKEQGRNQNFSKMGVGGASKENATAIYYYFCDQKAIDMTSQTSSETFRGRVSPPQSSPWIRSCRMNRIAVYVEQTGLCSLGKAFGSLGFCKMSLVWELIFCVFCYS